MQNDRHSLWHESPAPAPFAAAAEALAVSEDMAVASIATDSAYLLLLIFIITLFLKNLLLLGLANLAIIYRNIYYNLN